jgi:N-acetylmuramoyl-L-alanine amidase
MSRLSLRSGFDGRTPPGSVPFALVAATLLVLLTGPAFARTASRQTIALAPFEKAQRLHESLEGRSEQQRTRRDYEHVLEAYRAVYHDDPASPHADASISAVADLLAEQGRVFQDEKSLHDAIGQYEFLRREYPGSRMRFGALLTEAEIYRRDLGDRDTARSTFQQFLKLYPQSQLAGQARQELKEIRQQEVAERHGKRYASSPETAASKPQTPPASPRPAKPRSNTVLTAAIQSQQTDSQTSKAQSAHASEAAVPSPSTTLPVTPQPARATDATQPNLSDAVMNAPPPPRRRGRLPLVTAIRHWSTPIYTRVAIDLQDEVQYEAARVPSPDRIFFDLHGARLSPELIGKSVEVTDDGFLKRIRAAQFSNDVTRIVLDVSDVSEYSAFLLPNPYRLIIDIHGSKPGASRPALFIAGNAPRGDAFPLPLHSSANSANTASAPHLASPPATQSGQPASPRTQARSSSLSENDLPPASAGSSTTPEVGHSAASTRTTPPAQPTPAEDIADLGNQPNRVKATRRPTTAPIAASVAGTTPASQPETLTSSAATPPRAHPSSRSSTTEAISPPIHEADPTATGERSMVRALGLKIGRIVVDAGHGGHDSGTLGADGIQEKEIVLDVALRLGKLLKQRLGADVIYTRDDDTFIPLETRTAIANKAQADLFISVHGNSSPDSSARGVETYYLNFTNSADALEVAARENAVSDQSIHQLSDLVKKITLQDKISESREFATDVDQSLYAGLTEGNPGLKDRGIKKAPFVVLIGANMPSILAEISFLTNPSDAHQLRDPAYRQRIAESLYRGVARYVSSLSGVRLAQSSAPTGSH